jgi:hypothetical protein
MTALHASKSRKQSSPFPGLALPPLGKRQEAGQGGVGIEGRESHFTAVRHATFCGEPRRAGEPTRAPARLVWPWPALERKDAAAARPFFARRGRRLPRGQEWLCRAKITNERRPASAPGSGWRAPLPCRADDDSEKAEPGISLSFFSLQSIAMGTLRRDPLFAGAWARLLDEGDAGTSRLGPRAKQRVEAPRALHLRMRRGGGGFALSGEVLGQAHRALTKDPGKEKVGGSIREQPGARLPPRRVAVGRTLLRRLSNDCQPLGSEKSKSGLRTCEGKLGSRAIPPRAAQRLRSMQRREPSRTRSDTVVVEPPLSWPHRCEPAFCFFSPRKARKKAWRGEKPRGWKPSRLTMNDG